MSDVINKLRRWAALADKSPHGAVPIDYVCLREAVDEIERLQAIVDFVHNQLQMHIAHRVGRYGWRFRHGWPMTHAIGNSPEAAIQAAMDEVERSKQEAAEADLSAIKEPNHMWKQYCKSRLQEMRPYVPGEDLTCVSVSEEDTPEEGGMIARNPKNHKDQWYVAKLFFEDNYEEENP